jgi:hypothetical protein
MLRRGCMVAGSRDRSGDRRKCHSIATGQSGEPEQVGVDGCRGCFLLQGGGDCWVVFPSVWRESCVFGAGGVLGGRCAFWEGVARFGRAKLLLSRSVCDVIGCVRLGGSLALPSGGELLGGCVRLGGSLALPRGVLLGDCGLCVRLGGSLALPRNGGRVLTASACGCW